MVKKKNHEVGKSFLKPWRNNNGKLWVFDLNSQKIEERSANATFAINNYLYVPHVGDNRDDHTEEWFAEAENYLALLLKRIETKNFEKPISSLELFKALMGLIGLSYRSAYDLNKSIEAIDNDQTLKEKIGIPLNTEKEKHRFAVENMINLITKQSEIYSIGAVTIIYGLKNKFLICDRPGFDLLKNGVGINVIPVGPNSYLMLEMLGQNIAPLGLRFSESGDDESIVDSINSFSIDRARKWIIASSKEELEGIKLQLTSEKIKKRIEKDQIVFTSLSEVEKKRGWRLKDGA